MNERSIELGVKSDIVNNGFKCRINSELMPHVNNANIIIIISTINSINYLFH